MSRRRLLKRDKLAVANNYLAWLMNERRWNLQEAITYAQHGAAELELLRQRGRPDPQHCALCERYFDQHRASPHIPIVKTVREKAAARIADQPEDVRRWARVQQDCHYPGCDLPIHHSGPHHVPRDLATMLNNSIRSLDEREKQ